MYDSVNFILKKDDIGRSNFLKEVPCHLKNVGEHSYNGEMTISGNLYGLKVSLNQWQIKVKDGSLCKWHLGDNFQTMGRGDTQRAIEKLSDTLHLPMSKATVTRLDIAHNIITIHPPEIYINHLGLLKNAKRLLEPNGLYYSRTGGRLCFYDKIQEQKSRRDPVPLFYQNKNVFRYEQRYTKRIASQLGVPKVTGALLYDETFYIDLLNRWQNTYRDIKKVNDVMLNFQPMKTKQQFYMMGVLALVEKAGGQLEILNQIKEASKRGELSKKQAFDLRQAIDKACTIKEGLIVPNEVIKELDLKVSEAVLLYL